jgi:hypothetical protein
MSTKQLITNIETLSETLSEKQLIKFLDIMDTMTVMLDEAKKVTTDLKEYDFQPEHKYLH